MPGNDTSQGPERQPENASENPNSSMDAAPDISNDGGEISPSPSLLRFARFRGELIERNDSPFTDTVKDGETPERLGSKNQGLTEAAAESDDAATTADLDTRAESSREFLAKLSLLKLQRAGGGMS